ncbi:hypothetical protein EXIGLDRAFT_828900 [Exidia glandulosa HHB12029]|uniref:Uncharacterized protein n=1 Tax=Exidia glandulosa HHB12029 TaxID=1314781 RepID=A0A165PWI0_EXIGL|nr:hypothetical protein EXIGLDRAFT_828900 [Exidia glandulosa HHB12029]
MTSAYLTAPEATSLRHTLTELFKKGNTLQDVETYILTLHAAHTAGEHSKNRRRNVASTFESSPVRDALSHDSNIASSRREAQEVLDWNHRKAIWQIVIALMQRTRLGNQARALRDMVGFVRDNWKPSTPASPRDASESAPMSGSRSSPRSRVVLEGFRLVADSLANSPSAHVEDKTASLVSAHPNSLVSQTGPGTVDLDTPSSTAHANDVPAPRTQFAGLVSNFLDGVFPDVDEFRAVGPDEDDDEDRAAHRAWRVFQIFPQLRVLVLEALFCDTTRKLHFQRIGNLERLDVQCTAWQEWTSRQMELTFFHLQSKVVPTIRVFEAPKDCVLYLVREFRLSAERICLHPGSPTTFWLGSAGRTPWFRIFYDPDHTAVRYFLRNLQIFLSLKWLTVYNDLSPAQVEGLFVCDVRALEVLEITMNPSIQSPGVLEYDKPWKGLFAVFRVLRLASRLPADRPAACVKPATILGFLDRHDLAKPSSKPFVLQLVGLDFEGGRDCPEVQLLTARVNVMYL